VQQRRGAEVHPGVATFAHAARPWGNDEPSATLANFGKPQTNAYQDGLAPVGRHEAGKSPYGINDLAGNVSEWVADWYVEDLPTEVAWNPTGPASGKGQVIRGGGCTIPKSTAISETVLCQSGKPGGRHRVPLRRGPAQIATSAPNAAPTCPDRGRP